MKRAGYQGSYLIGFIIIGVVALRDLFYFEGQSARLIPLLASTLALYIGTLALKSISVGINFYISRPNRPGDRPDQPASVHRHFVPALCASLHSGGTRIFASVRVDLDDFLALLAVTLMLGLGWLEGLALVLLYLAVCGF